MARACFGDKEPMGKMLFLPTFNLLSGKHFKPNDFLSSAVLLGIAGIAVMTRVLSGAYPVLFLSGFQPIDTLRGNMSGAAGRSIARRILVVTQFFRAP